VVNLPRKAPKEVIEHRITLGNYEREQLQEIIKSNQRFNVVRNVNNSLQSLSFPLLAVAGLIYVGFSADEIIEDTKNMWNRIVDAGSDWMVKNMNVDYTADNIGREIEKVTQEKAELFGAMGANVQRYCDPNSPEFSRARCAGIQQQSRALERRETILRNMLNDIVEGRERGWFSGDDSTQRLQEYLQAQYQEQYREEYGESSSYDPSFV